MKIVFFLQIYIFILGVFSCNVTEEGKLFEIKFTTKTPPEDGLMLSWYKDDKLLADCPVDTGDCTAVDVNWFYAHVDRQNDSVEFIVNIPNVSRNSSSNAKGLWTLKTHSSSPISEILYTCMLQVYAKPDQVNCDAKWTTDELTISCKTKRIYPEAMMKIGIRNKPSTIISCENTRISTEPYYYNATCTFRIPTNYFHFKKNKMDIYIYPNIIGFYGSIGVNVSIDITIGTSAVQGNICVDRGKYIYCRCVQLNGTQAVNYIDWILNNTALDKKGFEASFTKQQLEYSDLGFNLISCRLQWKNNDDYRVYFHITIALAILLPLMIGIILFLLWTIYRKDKLKVNTSALDAVFFKKRKKNSPKSDECTNFLCQTHKNRNPTDENTNRAVPPDNSGNNFDSNQIEAKSVLLLMGTQSCNKYDISNNLLQRTTTSLKHYNKLLQVDYFQFKDRVFRLVNVPKYEENDKKTFLEMLNISICLSPEGYSAFIIVFTEPEYKEAMRIIYMLVYVFGKDVLNYLLIFLTQGALGSHNKKEETEMNYLCDGRCFEYDSSSDICTIIYTFVADKNYLFVSNHFKMLFEKSKSHTSILMENIIQDIYLLFESRDGSERYAKRKENLLDNWRQFKNNMKSSECRKEDLQYLIRFCVKERCTDASVDKNGRESVEDFQKCLQSVQYEHIKKVISERTKCVGNNLTLDEIYLRCLDS